MNIKDLKVGDYIMYDQYGVNECLFGRVTEIHPNILVLQGVYKRKSVDAQPGEIHVFDIEHIHNLKFVYADKEKGQILDRIYHITKKQYKEVEKAYTKYFNTYESICTTFRRVYFESKNSFKNNVF